MGKPSVRQLTRLAFPAGPFAAVAVGLGTAAAGLSPEAAWTAAVTTLCAVWWVFEPIPLAATSFIPFGLLPMAGVLSHREVAAAYGHHLVLLMLAGSMVSTAMERSDAHRRLAVGMVRAVGGSSEKRLILGFLLASTVLSMWMSNTATTVMLLPVALAVLASSNNLRLPVPLLLAVAYGASIGGSGTPIGTPPNLIFIEEYQRATGQTMGFLAWMNYGLPVLVIMVPVAWLWLSRRVARASNLNLPVLGPWRPDERRVLLVFALMALAWMTRSEPGGGWGTWLGVEAHAGDSTVAILATLVLFVVPRGDGSGTRLLDWETANRIPWGVFIMIGGGIAIGKAFGASGLDAQLGHTLGFLTDWPSWVVVPLLCIVATFATEVTSNTATATVFMPVLAAAAVAGDADPLWLMLPAALGLNHAFMLPVATAPNAIMYGTGRITTGQMAREGFVLNLLGVAIISTVCLLRAGSGQDAVVDPARPPEAGTQVPGPNTPAPAPRGPPPSSLAPPPPPPSLSPDEADAHRLAHEVIQRRQVGKPLARSPLVHDISLENPDALARFHQALTRLGDALDSNRKVRVVVYGSSNTAGDRYTGYLRGYLQARFGNGGPGFVAAVPLWKWHRHQEVELHASKGWQVTHDLQPGSGHDGRYGLMGVYGSTARTGAHIELRLRRNDATARRWSIWYDGQPDGGAFEVRVGDQPPMRHGGPAAQVGPSYADIELNKGASSLQIRSLGGGPIRLFGAVIERQGTGVVVDELGIGGSGARRVLRWNEGLWREQLIRRNPDLFVLAYGGIESMRKNYDAARWEREIGEVLDRFRRAAPEASCLVLAPQDRAPRGGGQGGTARRRPAALDSILAVLRRQALARDCAYFDTHAMMGGAGSMPAWVEAGLARGDHVHFTPLGYAHLGRVLVNATFPSRR